MPNHCINSLVVSGPFHEIKVFQNTFYHRANNKIYHLHLQPFYKDIAAIECKDRSEYDTNACGTKWGCYDFFDVILSENKLCMKFRTAWSPYNQATSIFMSRRHPLLEFHLTYAERGMGFVGERITKNGIIQTDICFDPIKNKILKVEESADDKAFPVERWLSLGNKFEQLWNASG